MPRTYFEQLDVAEKMEGTNDLIGTKFPTSLNQPPDATGNAAWVLESRSLTCWLGRGKVVSR